MPLSSRYTVARYRKSRFWGVWDGAELVSVCVYRRGAREVVRRLSLVSAIAA